MTNFATTNPFAKPFFQSDLREREREKWQRSKEKLRMYLATHKSVTVPVGRDRKIRTALRTNQISDLITVIYEKK